MPTMNNTKLNPNIRVTPQTRQTLKKIAAHTQETMLEVVTRLAHQEWQRIQKEEEGATKL